MACLPAILLFCLLFYCLLGESAGAYAVAQPVNKSVDKDALNDYLDEDDESGHVHVLHVQAFPPTELLEIQRLVIRFKVDVPLVAGDFLRVSTETRGLFENPGLSTLTLGDTCLLMFLTRQSGNGQLRFLLQDKQGKTCTIRRNQQVQLTLPEGYVTSNPSRVVRVHLEVDAVDSKENVKDSAGGGSYQPTEESEGSCKHTGCRNGGTCDHGHCLCPNGFYGVLCENEKPVDAHECSCEEGAAGPVIIGQTPGGNTVLTISKDRDSLAFETFSNGRPSARHVVSGKRGKSNLMLRQLSSSIEVFAEDGSKLLTLDTTVTEPISIQATSSSTTCSSGMCVDLERTLPEYSSIGSDNVPCPVEGVQSLLAPYKCEPMVEGCTNLVCREPVPKELIDALQNAASVGGCPTPL